MTTCPTCFLVRSAAGACDCEESLPNLTAVLERPVAPPKVEKDPRELVADGDLDNVYRVARALMDYYGLQSVRLEWSRSKRRIGTTYAYRNMPAYKISLSRTLFEHMDPGARMNTITHEIAHALVGLNHDHDRVWQLKHVELGGDGKRCSDLELGEEVETKIYKWTGRCPSGHVRHRAARSEKMYHISCGKCSSFYNPEYKYTWTQNF